MKKGPEVWIAICDKILAGNSLTVAARACGISTATLFRWLAASAETPEEFTFEWGPFGVATFAQHLKTANRGALAAIESEIYARVAGTSDAQLEPVYFQGRPQFKEREDIIRNGDQNQPPDTLMLLYGQPDIYERDADGERIKLYIRRAPSDALTLALMRAKNPRGGWADTRNVNFAVSGGVQVIGARKPMPPAAIAAPAVAEIVQQAIADDDATAAEEAADAALIPDTTPPEAEPEPEVAEASAALDPVAVAVADADDGARPGGESQLVADLKAKLAKKLAGNAAKPKPTPAATAARYVPLSERGEAWKIAHRDSADQDHISSGSPPPGYSGVTR